MLEKTKKLLNAGLPKTAVSKRKQGSFEVSYIEGWFAIEQANNIFGHDGWSMKVDSLEFFEGGKGHEAIARVRVEVQLEDRLVVKEDVGFGSCTVKQGRELAAKESVTDAMKRCFRGFGNAFGNSLYDKHNALHKGGEDTHVKLDDKDGDEILKSLERDLKGVDSRDGFRKVMAKYKGEIPKCPADVQTKASRLAKQRQKEIV